MLVRTPSGASHDGSFSAILHYASQSRRRRHGFFTNLNKASPGRSQSVGIWLSTLPIQNQVAEYSEDKSEQDLEPARSSKDPVCLQTQRAWNLSYIDMS